MWVCKKCGKEITTFMKVDKGYADAKINKNKSIRKAVLIGWEDGTQHYYCEGCGRKEDDDLEKIAYWVEEKKMNERTTEELEKKIAKLEEHKAIIKQAREFIHNVLDESEAENEIEMLWYIGNLIFKDMSITASELRYTKEELEKWNEEEK